MIDLQDVDFLDFGCSTGGSIHMAQATFGAKRGVGVDINAKKVARSLENGYEAILADATQLDLPDSAVSFSVMSHFLEHLPGNRAVIQCLASACRVSRDFVYIRHPWFDAEWPLFLAGYKFYWSDMKGHTTHVGAQQLDSLLRRVPEALDWRLFGRTPIVDWSDPAIVPLSAPANHGPNTANTLSGPLGFTAYRELCALVRVGTGDAYGRALMRLSRDHIPIN